MSQADEALKIGNAVRVACAIERTRLRTMSRTDARARTAWTLRNPTAPLDAQRLDRLLLLTPGIGETHIRTLLLHAGIHGRPPRIRDMTPETRELVAMALMIAPRDLRDPAARYPDMCPHCRAMGRELARLRTQLQEGAA